MAWSGMIGAWFFNNCIYRRGLVFSIRIKKRLESFIFWIWLEIELSKKNAKIRIVLFRCFTKPSVLYLKKKPVILLSSVFHILWPIGLKKCPFYTTALFCFGLRILFWCCVRDINGPLWALLWPIYVKPIILRAPSVKQYTFWFM